MPATLSVAQLFDKVWESVIELSIALSEHPTNPVELSLIPDCYVMPGDEIRYRSMSAPEKEMQSQLSQAWSLPTRGKVRTYMLGQANEVIEFRPLSNGRVLWLDLTNARRRMKKDINPGATAAYLVVIREDQESTRMIVTLVCLHAVSQGTRKFWRYSGLENIAKAEAAVA